MRDMTNMEDWVSLARLPWDMLTASMDFMWRASLPPGMYERYGQWSKCVRADVGNESGSQQGASSGSRQAASSSDEQSNAPASEKEAGEADLSGDDVKLVRYKILFTKRGEEKVLDAGDELISYNTNSSSYGALKIAEYLQNGGSSMPEDYHRYLKVQVEVLNQFPKESVDYNRRMLDLMEQQVTLLGSLRNEVESGRRAA